MGVPTTTMPDGTDITQYQNQPAGHRYYNNGLGNAGQGGGRMGWGRGGRGRGRGAQPRQPPVSHQQQPSFGGSRSSRQKGSRSSSKPKGVSKLRTERKIRKITTAAGASPATERSGVELLDELAKGDRNAATMAVYDAEEDADMVESQEVATTSIRLKKLQIRYRNGNGDNNGSGSNSNNGSSNNND